MKEIKKSDIIDFNKIRESEIKTGDISNIKKSYNNDSFNTINNYNITNCNFNHLEDPIENSNNRTKLKDKVGKYVRLWALAINEYNNFNHKDYIRYTVINVHDGEDYIADHLQIDIPCEIYNDNIRHKIILISGEIYEYANGTKQSMYVNDIKISHVNDLYLNKDYIKVISDVNPEDLIEKRNECIKYKSEDKFEMLIKYINELNHLINNMPTNFISNYIINQYTINYDPDSVNKSDYYMLRNEDTSIMEIMILITSIIKKLSLDEFEDMYSIFKYINWILNSMQGFSGYDNLLEVGSCKVAKDKKLRKFLPKAFIDFCDHHKLVIKKAYRYVLTRNLDYDCRSLDKSYAYRDAFQLIYSDSMKEEIIEDCMKLDEVD